MARDGLSSPPGQLRPPALLPSAVAGPPGVAVRALGTKPESPRAAREFTREALRRWDMYALFPDTAVVVSELVTNAGQSSRLRGHRPERRPPGAAAS
jgi:hypothetical protein